MLLVLLVRGQDGGRRRRRAWKDDEVDRVEVRHASSDLLEDQEVQEAGGSPLIITGPQQGRQKRRRWNVGREKGGGEGGVLRCELLS